MLMRVWAHLRNLNYQILIKVGILGLAIGGLKMEERRAPRVVTDLEVEAQVRGRSLVALVYDLSTSGCMVELPGIELQAGDNLLLNFKAFESGCSVVWETSGYAGVRFYKEIAPVMVAHLGFDPYGIPFSEVEPRDRFGRPLPPLKNAPDSCLWP